jgi:hypothetical protein
MDIITVIACSEAAEVLESVEAAFDVVAFFIEIFAVFVRTLEIGTRRDNDLHAPALQVTA